MGQFASLGLVVALAATGCTKTFTVPPGGRKKATLFGALLGSEHRIMAEVMKYGFPGTAMLRYREGYVLSYDARNRVPFWVAERLNPKRLKIRVDAKEVRFAPDKSIPEAFRARSADFVGSGYVRGRLAAALNHRGSREALEETYRLSNVAPMLGEKFRLSFWIELEARVRQWARDSDDLYVITGPLFLAREGGNGERYRRIRLIGEDQVGVPTHFFKVCLREKEGRREMQAFLVPHEPIAKGTPLTKFLTSVDEIERLSGLDFFPELSEPTQSRLEAATPPAAWGEQPRAS